MDKKSESFKKFTRALKLARGFTLLELLIVIAILAVLATVVILVINPAEYLKQSRDASRFSDMDNLNKALSLYQLNGQSMGTSSIVYVSIPDTVSTCANLSLPTLPTGYSYYCSTSQNFKNTDGTGWIPLNFKNLPGGSPIGFLPADPVNSTSSRNYYAYSTNGTNYEITAAPESSKFKLGGANDKVSTDGGNSFSLYEKGDNLTLQPLDYGDSSLVDFWHMNNNWNDGQGTNNGSLCLGSNATFGAPKIGSNSAVFNNNKGVVFTKRGYNDVVSVAFWFKTSSNAYLDIMNDGPEQALYGYYFAINNGRLRIVISSNVTFSDQNSVRSGLNDGAWHYFIFTRSTNLNNFYIDGILDSSSTVGGTIDGGTNLVVGGVYDTCLANAADFLGSIDEVSIYNRALSASEVAAIYNANK